MKKEIEVKVRVKELETLKTKLLEVGCVFSDPVEQDDVVFVNYDGDYNRFPEGANYLRIRKTKEKSFLTLKRGSEMAGIEKETEISNPDDTKEILELMGYHEVVQVKKVRTKTQHEDYEICLDDVEDLGLFVEVEKIADEDPDVVQNEMITFLENLGVEVSERVLNGYDTLMYRKLNSSK